MMRLINGDHYEFNLVSEAANKHFAEPTNYTAFILDEWETNPYKDYLKPGSVILDIGANVGLFALHVLPYADKIICVEPTPAHMVINREINPTSIHEQSALNSYTGKTRFHHEPVNTTMNTIRQDGVLEVDCITLKDLCDKYSLTSVDFAKVDIEGSEWQALTVERIAEVKDIIKSFFVELHPRSEESQRNMAARFGVAGYKVKHIDYNGSIYCHL